MGDCMDGAKMEDVFRLPVSFFVQRLDSDQTIPIQCDGEGEFRMIDVAINSYDSNQELITKQQEQIELLREALEVLNEATEHVADESMILFMSDGRMLNIHDINDMVSNALAATAKG